MTSVDTLFKLGSVEKIFVFIKIFSEQFILDTSPSHWNGGKTELQK